MARGPEPGVNAAWGGGRQGSAGAGPVLLVLLCALFLLPCIGLYPLFDVDEGAFSEATREILRSGDWLSTTLNGVPRYDKPILIYWLQAASVGALGLNEFALRLPSALAALAWIGAIVRFAAPRMGERNALLGGWVAATSLGVFAMSRAATADALLNALLAAMMFDLWRHLEHGGGPGGRSALRRTYLWMALGVLTKGPIAILIPLAVSLAYCASAGRWRDWLRAVADPAGWLILLAVAAPWYGWQLHIHGREFIDGFLVRHNLDRFSGTLEGHSGSLWYYLAVLPLLLLPWSGLLWQAARRAPGQWGQPLARYLLLWFAFVFVFFSLSGTKLPHYLLYGMTPVFLLVGRQIAVSGTRANLVLPACGLLLLLPAVPALLQAWSQRDGVQAAGYYVAQAQRSLAAAGTPYYLVTVACAAIGLALGLGLWRARAWPAWRRGVAATALLAVSLGYGFVPWLGDVLNGPQKRAGLFAAALPGTAVQWEFAAPSFSVYRRQITPSRPPQPGELAITRSDRLDPAVPAEILFREGGVVLLRRK
jgi:4-amino-4-deoxy-L-arabinose transferase-like glycosyltransferase